MPLKLKMFSFDPPEAILEYGWGQCLFNFDQTPAEIVRIKSVVADWRVHRGLGWAACRSAGPLTNPESVKSSSSEQNHL